VIENAIKLNVGFGAFRREQATGIESCTTSYFIVVETRIK